MSSAGRSYNGHNKRQNHCRFKQKCIDIIAKHLNREDDNCFDHFLPVLDPSAGIVHP